MLATARGIADEIAANPPHAVRLAKRLMREGMHSRLDTLLEMSAAFQALSHQTADHREAVIGIHREAVAVVPADNEKRSADHPSAPLALKRGRKSNACI